VKTNLGSISIRRTPTWVNCYHTIPYLTVAASPSHPSYQILSPLKASFYLSLTNTHSILPILFREEGNEITLLYGALHYLHLHNTAYTPRTTGSEIERLEVVHTDYCNNFSVKAKQSNLRVRTQDRKVYAVYGVVEIPRILSTTRNCLLKK
jgi:hypothetical protein